MLNGDDPKQIRKIMASVVSNKLAPLYKKMDVAISYFDTVTSGHEKRIKRVENRLELPPLAD
ncbi:hypothetical protein A2Z33_01970 [Candidatus Gottesmanbacteria bacterium RBG_16_52_11]|uniref:Uncharacterized protein n=1 Tax=Candidatus Gottesmanbacteria bacterium RBG_16_52_11 TaxID=1798374 RepID=A0A1F5YQR4_9BACT|nr:MAG: hypothetical protein A2Z33_01970 [Candidatus Gottesmanbacteria bacterium RBG_16_52_11]